MKRRLLLLSVLSVFFLAGCTKNELVIPNTTVITTINPGDWKYDNSTKTYYVNISMPEITSQVNQTDGILVSVSFGNDLYELIPDIYHGYSFYVTHQTGVLTVEAEDQFNTTLPPSGAMQVKIVIVPSN
jgi:hypothetical protein